MRMDLGLSQQIKQIQTLSPQMYMSMEILCLNSLDLEERIETELENNVALEVQETEKESSEETSGDGTSEAPTEAPTAEGDDFDGKVEQWDQLARDEYDFGPRRSSYDGEKDDKLEALNNTEGRPLSLAEHLEEQLHLLSDSDLEEAGVEPSEIALVRSLCHEIVYNLDARGYLLYPIEEIYETLLERGFAEESIDTPGGVAPEDVAFSKDVAPDDVVVSKGVAPDGVAPDGVALRGGVGRGVVDAVATPARPEPEVVAPPRELPHGEDSFPRQVRDEPDADPSADGAGERPDERSGAGDEITLEVMKKALEVVRRLEPPGIGGTDLQECLLLQFRRDKQLYPIETRIIEEYLDDLANNRLPKIAKALGITIDDVKSAAETITSLNPIPGKLFGGEAPHYIKPDVIVEEINGRYEVQVVSDYLPRLRVSDYYLNLYKRSRKDPELKKFIKKKLESAEWLLQAIRQRQSTLERIAREIVEIQSDFLTHGISRLKPLKMVDVAERVGVHVSTISRAISGKYMQTPRGLYDLKFFFSGGAQKSDGTMEARGSVIQRIKDLVDIEDKGSPLSDIDIVRKLEESGIKISRRTVTKYREAESIPSSRQRRTY